MRDDLIACRDESPEHREQALEARRRLPKTVERAVDAVDLSDLVSEDEIAARAGRTRRPRVGNRGGGILVAHGVGVAIGLDPRVSRTRRTRVDGFHIR